MLDLIARDFQFERMGRGGAGGGGGVANIVAPSIDANQYAGGPYAFSEGVWNGSPTLAMTLESSADGLSGWADEGVVATVGTWDVSLAGLFVRLKVTPDTGSPAYSAVFGALGPAYNQVVDFGGNSNRINHTVTAPFIGADLAAATSGASAPGFWLMAMWYYDGVGIEAGAALVSLGDVSVASTHAEMSAYQVTAWRAGGTNCFVTLTAPAAAGWYLTTCHYYNSGANHGVTIWVGDQTAVAGLAAGAISLTNFTTLRIGSRVTSAPDNATNFDERIAYVAFGRGNPGAAHTWSYNDGSLRRVDDYDFAADTAATIEGFIPLYRESPGNTTFSVGAVVDTIGAFDSWTLDGTLAYENRLPGFINPAGDPPATPSRYIYPRYASTDDATFTLGINTKAIGTAVAGDFTVTALTHSVAGNIAGTVTGTTFPNPGAGTITGTISGVSVAVEIVAPLALPADPQFRTRYHGNARVAGIEPYTSPGAGTTYANVAALKVGIDALGAGATLIVADLNDASTLTLTAKDYGGATITCTNLHGVKLGDVVMTGVIGLTIRGVDVVTHAGEFYGDSGVSGVTLDHCTGLRVFAKGTTGSTETFVLRNWVGPDDGTAQQITISKFNRATIHRVAHANTSTLTSDAIRTDQCNTIFADRFFFGEIGVTTVGAHADCWQSYLSGTSGSTGGLIMNGALIDRQETGEIAAQGGFWNDVNGQHLRIVNCAVYSSLNNSLIISAAQGCGFENCMGNSTIATGAGSTASSFYSLNIIRGSVAPVLTNSGIGTETGTVNASDMTTLFPNWVAQAGNWQMWETPTGAAVGKGAHALITELVANRAIAP